MLSTDQGPLTALQERFVIDKKIFYGSRICKEKWHIFSRKHVDKIVLLFIFISTNYEI